MVTNPVAENTCASNGTQDDCVSEEIPFIISKATNKIYDQKLYINHVFVYIETHYPSYKNYRFLRL